MDTTLEITSHRDPDGRSVLTLRGEVDIRTGPRLRAALDEQIARGRPLVLDVAGAVLIDAAGLRVLTSAQRRAAELGRPPITLRGVRPLFAKTLDLTGLDHLFPREPAPAPVLAGTAPGAGRPRQAPPAARRPHPAARALASA
ncbi:STAS domain-containing protein [Actinospica sp. MGRD01-02]|uniref:STAS domain-containing protein n=1 Tax=Actinospica acidithermotolerans TaxID=2828514 RepID=A0A941E3K5_9ACTN|nr:STAS domain-containing protein [Actinospica acidithermotolerans]MBR7825560.1 STAS domain-containing protein [Actinospica acidithermotolerans]